MAASHASGFRFGLVLLALFSGFLACGYLVWERRVPWHTVAVLMGSLPPQDSVVPYVFDPEKGSLYFADTRELYVLPSEYREKIEITKFPSSRASFQFTTEEAGGGTRERCWNMAAHREVPLPDYARGSWRLSSSGTRILIEDFQSEKPRRFQILGLDGSVLHERVLPALDDRSSDVRHDFSDEGRFLIVTFADSSRVHLTRIYDMESQDNWPFADRFAALSEEGVVWLKDAGSAVERSCPETLRAVRLSTGEELWRMEVPEGVSTTAYLGRDRLAVGLPGESGSTVVFDARDGRRLFTLESRAFLDQPLEIRAAGPRSILVSGGTAWDFDTGSRLPFDGPYPGLWFFDDGHRALVDARCGCPAGVADVETGKLIFRFRSDLDTAGAYLVRPAGNKVLSAEYRAGNPDTPIQLWERRHPEGWQGHLERPEVLGAVLLGAAILVLLTSRPRS